MIKKHTKQIIEVTMAFSLLVVVAGLLGIFLKPSVTGAVVLNNELSPSSAESITIYLVIALVFFVVYTLYLNMKKNKK